MKKISLYVFLILFLISCSDNQTAQLEKKYIKDLKSWIKNGSRDANKIKDEVQTPCSKLVMLMATKKEKAAFIARTDIEEYDFRAGFCMSAVIENVWPNQPGFTKKFKKQACKEKIPLIKLVCKEFI